MSTSHRLHLFDDTDSRAATVAEFIYDGLSKNEAVVVVTIASHAFAIQTQLKARFGVEWNGLPPGSLTFRDAYEQLNLLTRAGKPHAAEFERSVVPFLSGLQQSHGAVRVYGEMVDILAAEGNFRGAETLERIWNELLAQQPMDLLCGYSASAFGHPRDAEALHRICDAHSHVQTNPHDVLGQFLIGERGLSR